MTRRWRGEGRFARRGGLVALAVVVAILASAAFVTGPATAGDSAAILDFDPDETDADPGETVTVNVTMSDHGDLYGNGVVEFALTVGYDRDVLRLTDVDHDPWLDDGTAAVETTSTVDEESGELTLAEERETRDDGVTASGTVATLTFVVADDADPTNAALTFEETSIVLASEYPHGALEYDGTIYVDGGVEPAEDGDDDPDGITLGEGGDDAAGSDDDASGGDDRETADDSTTDGAETIPGFGAVAALAVLVGIALTGIALVVGRTGR